MAEINEREFNASDRDALIISGLKEGTFKILLNADNFPLITKDSSKEGFSCLIHLDGLNPFNICSLTNELTFGEQSGELFRAIKKEPVYTGSFVTDLLKVLMDANRKPIAVKTLIAQKMQERNANAVSIEVFNRLCSKRDDHLLCKGWARNEDGKRRPSKFWVDADDEYRIYKIEWAQIESVAAPADSVVASAVASAVADAAPIN